MTTDGFAVILLAAGALIMLTAAALAHRRVARRQQRLAPPPDWTPPVSIADWRQRAEASQRRSDARRAL